jgi:AcrR family transcriptional regulator
MSASPSRVTAGRETRAPVFDAAIRRLAASGPDASFATIAAEVGVTQGALCHRFGSEEGLVEAVYKETVRCHAERVVEASSTGTTRQRLRGQLGASARLYGSDTPFHHLLLRLHVEAASRPHLATIALRVQHRQREYVNSRVAVGDAVNAAVQGLLVQQREPPDPQRRMTKTFADLLEALL